MSSPRSIFYRAIGDEFDRLHPLIQQMFGFSSADELVAVSDGMMEEIWHGRFYMRPFLRLGERRSLLFAERARDVPFTLRNYAYVDGLGRETVTWNRVFATSTPRRFDEFMVYSPRRRSIVVYAGSHQHLAVEMRMKVTSDGGLSMRTGAQRFYEFPVGIRFPLMFSGTGRILLSADSSDRLNIDVKITNPIWGRIFGYRGWFTTRLEPCALDQIPDSVRPAREEGRE